MLLIQPKQGFLGVGRLYENSEAASPLDGDGLVLKNNIAITTPAKLQHNKPPTITYTCLVCFIPNIYNYHG